MKNKWHKKGYSLFEVIVTLSIVTILMVMMTNTLLLSLEISRKSLVRSNLREEQNDILNKISKDIRNAQLIRECSGTNEIASCEVLLDKKYTWTTCDSSGALSICKKVNVGTTNEQVIESSSDDLVVKNFTIDEGIVEADGKKSIVVTLIVNINSDTIDIEDQVRQIVISTRNFSV